MNRAGRQEVPDSGPPFCFRQGFNPNISCDSGFQVLANAQNRHIAAGRIPGTE